ncbi:MAG: tRNA (adenosine(37)-N6)-threonylcarbamoyltransferase complex transferase subunit TsaD [Syntrophobacterales bacterium]|nr:tRNA (adenosine(37)-N6)-threonylcarbamoyltransferase complex transferase subunit TsaD [Syntrophobacterales bacterium]
MLVLGIESSCDETAAAVVKDGSAMLSNVIASQVRVHERYGGVVPEIASRKHIEAIAPVIIQSLEDAAIAIDEIDAIAVTKGPGLVGSLLIGLSTAKALAFGLRLPLVGVNHLEGHIAAIFLTDNPPAFPFVALAVSGGHTSIYFVKGFSDFTLLGQTRDDAAGEAFDKAANLLGIGYPGGVEIDRLAKKGNPLAFNFPRAMRDSLDFSFSGLKTALLTKLKKRDVPLTPEEIPDYAASFQEAICDVLTEKTIRATQGVSTKRIVVCGGVAANSRLREKMYGEAQAAGIDVFIPPAILCTDNAAMIAVVGNHLLQSGVKDGLDLNAVSRIPIAAAI